MAATKFGYTQATWDNVSGKEEEPTSAYKIWSKLTDDEKAAAMVLGYTPKNWENLSGKEKYPASASKSWSELSTTCGESRANHTHTHLISSKCTHGLQYYYLIAVFCQQ